jgi:type VI protein secretion system component VasK
LTGAAEGVIIHAALQGIGILSKVWYQLRSEGGMFWIIWIAAACLVAVGWAAYGIWNYLEDQKEKKRPKPAAKQVEQVKKSFEEYTKKMESYQKPTYKREQQR